MSEGTPEERAYVADEIAGRDSTESAARLTPEQKAAADDRIAEEPY